MTEYIIQKQYIITLHTKKLMHYHNKGCTTAYFIHLFIETSHKRTWNWTNDTWIVKSVILKGKIGNSTFLSEYNKMWMWLWWWLYHLGYKKCFEVVYNNIFLFFYIIILAPGKLEGLWVFRNDYKIVWITTNYFLSVAKISLSLHIMFI